MATEVSFGSSNSGFQVGVNHGSINNHFYSRGRFIDRS